MKLINFFSKPTPKQKMWAIWKKPEEVTTKDILNSINKIKTLLEQQKK